MTVVEIWERRRSSSEDEPYESVDETSYEESEEGSDYDRHYRPIDLFDNDLYNKKYREGSESEERRLDKADSNDNSGDGLHHFESDYSVNDDSGTDVFDYVDEWRHLQLIRAYGKVANDIYYNFDNVPRTWMSVFYISAMHNLENSQQNFFYSIHVGHINPEASSSFHAVKMYTPLYSLGAGERYTFRVPIFLWKKKKLVIPYGEFKNYMVKIDLWKKHKFTLNTLHATQTLTFDQIISNKSNFTISLNRTVPKITESSEKDKNMITEDSEQNIPMHKLSVVMLLEEIFDFLFVFENWWFTKDAHLPDHIAMAPKSITISMQSSMGGRFVDKQTPLSYDDYWSEPGSFIFRGTIRQMKISYFTVRVYYGVKKLWSKRSTLLGTCVMSLKSVKEYPLVRGTVKQVAVGTQNIKIGTIQGNIRCSFKSSGLREPDFVKKRLSQPISGSALLTHLDKSCQYLVIRVLRCEHLPATNTDTNTSNPLVKVKWDGIVNFTSTMESTTSPVYNQNMYFPVHLVDPRELYMAPLIKYSLPLDLGSKGPVIMEVWDSDDTSSEFLGAVEIPLSRIFNDGLLDERSLVDGIYNEASSHALGSQDVSDQNDFVTYSGFSNDIDSKYKTKIYNDSLTLTGYTVPHRGSRPSIAFEMYFLPPMPLDLKIPNDRKRQVKSDTYRDLSHRWDREFELWQKMYKDQTLSNFPYRRFLTTTSNNSLASDVLPSEIIVLSRFLTPIQVSSHLRPPGKLLHWISNFGLKEDALEKFGGLSKIESWQHPSRFLTTRKGGLQDRVLLLCSCLLGLGYDAYVCKGTIKNGMVEHCWVMTRHSDSTVSFWETGNKKIWHLPRRWRLSKPKNSLFEDAEPSAPLLDNYQAIAFEPSANLAHFSNQSYQENGLTKFEIYGNDYVPDQRVDVSTLIHHQDEVDFDTSAVTENLNRILYENPKKKVEFTKTLQQIRPREELAVPGETLVFVPYSSIETVFNNKQLWGNVQNHHPASILYDLDEPAQWKPFLKVTLEDEFVSNIQITEPPSDHMCHETATDIINEVGDMIEVMRGQRGLRCTISRDVQMFEHLDEFLKIMETRQRLDPQFDPGMPPNLLGWSNRRKMKKLNKILRAKEVYGEMQKSTQLDEEYDVSTDASSETREEPVNEDQDEHPEETKSNQDSNASARSKGTQPSVQVPECGEVQQEHGQEEQIKPRKSARRSRSRRGPKPEKKSKKIKNTVVSDPVHSSLMRYGTLSSILNPGGFRVAQRVTRKRVTKLASFTHNVRKASKDEVVHCRKLTIPDFPIKVRFDASLNESSPAMSQTPMSQLSSISLDMYAPKFCSHVIRAATHRMAPPHASRAPVSNKIRMRVEKRNMKLINRMNQPGFVVHRRNNILNSVLSKVKRTLPDLFNLPGFDENMRKVVPMQDHYKGYAYKDYNIPSEFKVFQNSEITSWFWYYEQEARHYSWQQRIPVLANHTFVGIPVHFCTSDVYEIRNLLCSNRRFRKLMLNRVDDAVFVIYAKAFPLLGNVLSTWLFIGCHIPWRL